MSHNTIIIRNLDRKANEDILKKLFADFGAILKVLYKSLQEANFFLNFCQVF